MAEDLTTYYQELGVKVRYLHSDIETLERVEILRDLRRGAFDVLVGINLLREGLDLPEVSLVAILDADKEGFLRSAGLAHPDLRPRGAQRERPGHHVCGYDHGIHEGGTGRDGTAAGPAGGLQRRARHHAGVGGARHRRRACRASTNATTGAVPEPRETRRTFRTMAERDAEIAPARSRDEGGRAQPRLRARRDAARHHQGTPHRRARAERPSGGRVARAGLRRQRPEAGGARGAGVRAPADHRRAGRLLAALLHARSDRAARSDRHRLADRRRPRRVLHRRGAGASVRHHARPVRRAPVRRPAGQRVDGQGARAGAHRA